MNSTFYIFGKFNGSYAQFPVDYTQDIFQRLPNRSSFSNTQLVIHRDGNLMYYCYMRKLEQDNFIGFCLLLNDAMIEEIPALFELFDNGISHLALAGEIVKINDNGDIVSNTDSLLSNRQTIQQIANNMMRDLNHLVETRKKLPAQSLAVSQDEIKRFNIRDDAKQIVDSALSYALVFVTKDEDSQNIDSYRSTIKRLKEENKKLQEENSRNIENSDIVYKKGSNTEMWIFLSVLCVFLGYLSYIVTKNKSIKPIETTSFEQESLESTNEVNANNHIEKVDPKITEIKNNRKYYVILETESALYYVADEHSEDPFYNDEMWFDIIHFLKYDKQKKTDTVISITEGLCNGAHKIYVLDKTIIFQGPGLVFSGLNDVDWGLFFDTNTDTFVDPKGRMMLGKLRVEDGILKETCSDDILEDYSTYFKFDVYRDNKGNIVDGYKIIAKGYNGIRDIELNLYIYEIDRKIVGYCKYPENRFVYLKGDIDRSYNFNCYEYDSDENIFGEYSGKIDFNNQKLIGKYKFSGEIYNLNMSPFKKIKDPYH